MPLHNDWNEYTDEEITRLSRYKCIHCRYNSIEEGRRKDLSAIGRAVCNYMLQTGHRRPWRPEECPPMPPISGKRAIPTIVFKGSKR